MAGGKASLPPFLTFRSCLMPLRDFPLTLEETEKTATQARQKFARYVENCLFWYFVILRLWFLYEKSII